MSELETINVKGIVLTVVNDTIQIKLPDNLKIQITGDIDLTIDGKFNIDATCMNFVTRRNPINMDSVRSNIYLNSLTSEQLKDDKEEIPEISSHNQIPCNQNLQMMFEKIVMLDQRLTDLEERENDIIDLLKQV